MKKIIYLFIILQIGFFNTLSAQLEKGSIMLDGSIFLGFDDEDEFVDFSSISTPTAGYFVLDNFLLGMGLELRTTKNNRNFGDAKNRQFNFKPFARYYFGNGKLKPFGQLDLEFSNFKSKFSSFEQKQSFTNVFLKVGFDYFLSPNVALETNFSFRLKEDINFINFPKDDLKIYLGDEGRTHFSLGFKFFLNNQAEKGATTTAEPLVSRYLKAGNQSIGLRGFGIVANGDFQLAGGITWQKFTRDNRRWSHSINTLMFEDSFNDFIGNYAYRPEFEPFISVASNTYVVPSIGVNLGIGWSEPEKNIIFGGTFHPKLIHFFNNALMEIGLDVQTPTTDFEEELNDWSGQFILAGEYFIQNNLSLRGEVNVRAFGEPNIQDLDELYTYQYLPKSRMNIGFNYFFNKANRLKKEETGD